MNSITVFNVSRFIVVLVVGGVGIVEIIGYFWHRFGEHIGIFGDEVRYHHWIHHEKDYPTTNLRPKADKYKSAGSWTWYVLAGIIITTSLLAIPLAYSIPMIIGGVLYAGLVVDYFHKAFHLPDNWLHRFRWFRRLTELHDIHHYELCNYGIVFFGMDRLFRTFRKMFPAEPQDLFPGYTSG